MPKLTKEERIEAEILAAHMLACRARDRDVRKQLREKFAMSRHQAAAIVKAVRDSWATETEAAKVDILAETFRSLDEATTLAFQKKDVRGVVQVERLRAEIAGLIGSDVRLVAPPKEPKDDLKGKPELDVNAQAVFLKDWAELTPGEQGVVVQVLRERGDHDLAAEAESRMMN